MSSRTGEISVSQDRRGLSAAGPRCAVVAKIRRMVPSEASFVSRVIRSVVIVLSYYSPEAIRSELAKYSPRKLQLLLRNDPDAVLLSSTGSDVTGFCISSIDEGTIWLAWFGVLDAWRGQGLGLALLGALETTLERRNCHKIWCDTRASNKASQSILAKAGYRRICRLHCHWHRQEYYLWEKFFSKRP